MFPLRLYNLIKCWFEARSPVVSAGKGGTLRAGRSPAQYGVDAAHGVCTDAIHRLASLVLWFFDWCMTLLVLIDLVHLYIVFLLIFLRLCMRMYCLSLMTVQEDLKLEKLLSIKLSPKLLLKIFTVLYLHIVLAPHHAEKFSSKFLKTHFRVLDLWIGCG